MTVAAVIISVAPGSALGDADGLARVRRLADVAWSGGAMPVIVVAPDPDGSVAAALAGAEATLASPAPQEGGPAAQMVRGIETALGEVHETTAALLWPARLCWVGPETVTSLIEAHGATPDALVQPAYHGETGWPCLVPLHLADRLRAVAPDRMPDDVLVDLAASGNPIRAIELGDPGTVIDGSTPRSDLPPYEGPPKPASDDRHEWGSGVADRPEDEPRGPRGAG